MSRYSIIIIAVASVLLLGLAGCNTTEPKPTLELDSEQETVEALQAVFDEASYYQYDDETEIYTVYDTHKSQIGYAFYGEGMGEGIAPAEGLEKYPGPIIIMIGLKDTETLEGIFVVSHSETEMFWELLIRADYIDEFSGIKIEDVRFERFGGQVDGNTGATLSTNLVLNTVKDAIQEKLPYIEGGSQ